MNFQLKDSDINDYDHGVPYLKLVLQMSTKTYLTLLLTYFKNPEKTTQIPLWTCSTNSDFIWNNLLIACVTKE